ncbi:helix-turn-helix transcriptional regulator [Rhizobium oryzicola]|uniref:YafY family protein n=1 Tax=Rhizobium oryzicola TaxID=1232668 RepID=A0ABT8SU18_9HYPH|nr:YafY family protein [Rhizobium oryzicola]MDO1581907.1 YafY family protein [Rhizobium oryzicola]
MSRSARLLDLLQILRRYRHPVAGTVLAEELGISLRTLYRDIATLQAQGAEIEGEAGVGYVLTPSYMLPPLMFTHGEIEALILGFRFVSQRADPEIARDAVNALAKIEAVLPAELRSQSPTAAFLAGPSSDLPPQKVSIDFLRQAMRQEQAIQVDYRDLSDKLSRRIIWPCALTYFDETRLLVAWCTLRHNFRHFRTDRIEAAELVGQRYPRRRATLVRQWQQQQGLSSTAVK